MDKINVFVEVEINPTESEEKVKHAIENVFGDIPTQIKSSHEGNFIVAEKSGKETLTKFHNLLRRERVRNAARKLFFERLSGETISFCLNKQVAYAGHISFSKEVAESPLGPIRVTINCKDPKEVINWLTSRIP